MSPTKLMSHQLKLHQVPLLRQITNKGNRTFVINLDQLVHDQQMPLAFLEAFFYVEGVENNRVIFMGNQKTINITAELAISMTLVIKMRNPPLTYPIEVTIMSVCLQAFFPSLNTLTPWKESYDQPRQHIKKQRYYLVRKGSSSQGYGFSSGHVWM